LGEAGGAGGQQQQQLGALASAASSTAASSAARGSAGRHDAPRRHLPSAAVTCITPSKPKLEAFQEVNSPAWVAASRRRPSGV
jgi:hypothetical protein